MFTSALQSILVDHTSFAYKTFGEGEPLVLLQRFRGTINDWDPAFIGKLAENNKVIVFDNRGIGLSEGNTPKTILEIATDALKFTQALNLEKFNLLGWSLGGIIAQVMAIHFPECISKLILVGTGPAGSNETIYPSNRFLEIANHDINPLEDHQVLFFTETSEGFNHARRSLDRIQSINKPEIPETKRENWTNQALAMRDFFANELNYFARLKEIKCPVLIGAATQDLAFPLLDAYLLAREIPDSYLVSYTNAGHGFHHQYFTSFGNTVNAFLNGTYLT
jgi:pimeloyl-ACP methyl ester carboxylesterase